ncbi:MAG: GGDEF domain-containing phosphodiesterase [Bacteroidales bacterium]|nr:GGDEF domain-containing phosphodiesterase [Clostridium sp.]MCM1204061.1 GGDEF domain-containing phosphodiesterase [Bacteroidales bacterium]
MAFSKEVINIIQSMNDVLVMFWDVNKGWNIVNGNCLLLSGKKTISNALEDLSRCVQAEDKATYHVFLYKIMAGMQGSVEFIPIKEDRVCVSVRMSAEGEIYTYHKVECFLMKDEAGAVIQMNVVVCALDAEEIYRLQLSQSVTNDRNPTMFIRAANEVIKQNPEKNYALVQFDVAKFKAINEMYGEAFGDEMLNFFIEALKVICDKDQLFIRLTADVFMVLMHYETREDILNFIETVNESLLGYKDIAYRLVFGVSFVEDMKEPLRKYGDRAALARQSIKGNALTYVAFYEEEMKDSILSGKYMEDHMEKALTDHEFVMYLQPKYSIQRGKIVGAEALVRWVQPDKGVISPADFIPLFEKNGFVTKMDAYIWEEACKTIRNWIDAGIEPIPISVNVSRVHLKNNRFIKVLNDLVEKYQIPKEYLEIEITETIEDNMVSGGITLLKENGYILLMDDFGSGYSSLNTLKDTQFDVIKIDRGFLQDFIGSDRGQKIVMHTIQMTKSIGLDLVAEGVETKEQAMFLMDCGCDTAQGFYYAKPMPVEEFNQNM